MASWKIAEAKARFSELIDRVLHGTRGDSADPRCLMAATALVHQLTLVTRNGRDLASLDVPIPQFRAGIEHGPRASHV